MIRIAFPEATSGDVGGIQYSTLDLIEHLAARILPFHTLKPFQVRVLYDRYRHVLATATADDGLRELVRLLLALPQFELQ